MTHRFPEEALINKVKEARRCAPSILYLPDFQTWCKLASRTLRNVLEVTCKYHMAAPVLFVAVAEGGMLDVMPTFEQFVGEVPQYVGGCLPQVYELQLPTELQRKEFFQVGAFTLAAGSLMACIHLTGAPLGF